MLVDCVFVFLNTATTIAAVMRTLGRNSSGKRARSPKRKKHNFSIDGISYSVIYRVFLFVFLFFSVLLHNTSTIFLYNGILAYPLDPIADL